MPSHFFLTVRFSLTKSRVCFYSTRLVQKLYFASDIVRIEEQLEAKIDSSRPKVRNHPGKTSTKVIELPLELKRSLLTALSVKGSDIPYLTTLARDLAYDLDRRQAHWTDDEIGRKRLELEDRISNNPKFQEPVNPTPEDLELYRQRRQSEIGRRMRHSVYKWKPIQYLTPDKCFIYCLARLAPDFATLRRVLQEILIRDPDFKPRSVFDFGSGVGSTFWVCNNIWKNVEEYYLVDLSSAMNNVAELLLRSGDPDGKVVHKAVFFRQFLPSRHDRRYDLVVCAFTLMELPSYEERMRIVVNLWAKTEKYLVFIENGSYAGNKCVLSARDFILAGGNEVLRTEAYNLFEEQGIDRSVLDDVLDRKDLWEYEKLDLLHSKVPGLKLPTLLEKGHVFAPCCHDMVCPKVALNDPVPCHFQVRYKPLSLADKVEEETRNAKFSYVILKKGSVEKRWPRIVAEVLCRHKHVCARLCTKRGLLEEIIATKSRYGNVAYRIVKESQWGDLLPLETEIKDAGRNAADGSGSTEKISPRC